MAAKKSIINLDVSKKIDEYIGNAEPFAQPILSQIRRLIQQLNIGLVEEWKWSSPNFSHRGLVCMIWSFKKHAAIHFFKGALLSDPYKVLSEGPGGNVSARHIKFYSIEDVDLNILREYIIEAVQIDHSDLKIESLRSKRQLEIPDYFLKSLNKNKIAKRSFEGMSSSHQKEYVIWITDAKKEETRLRRVDQTIDRLLKHADKNIKK